MSIPRIDGTLSRPCRDWRRQRRAAVLPLFALLLPALLLLTGFAVNVAYMQLTRTELKVATDAAGKAGGRAFSEFQDVDQALAFARNIGARNKVAGDLLDIDITDNSGDVDFGSSTRTGNGYGRYVFTPRPIADVRSMQTMASSIRIRGSRKQGALDGPVRLPFSLFGPLNNFEPEVTSIVTQVDRDIALILDRSGSMIDAVYDWSDYYQETQQWQWRRAWWGWHLVQVTVRTWDPPEMEQRYETFQEQYDAYWNDNGPVPDDSRWTALEAAVSAFLDVLERTDQEEQVSVATFSSAATLDLQLTSTYSTIRSMLGNKRPNGATSIGAGMQSGFPTLISSFARPYAGKTIVVLTDGINNTNPTPQSVATSIVTGTNVTIHTVTLSDEADQSAMRTVAQLGNGRHYHADDLNSLVDIFREIANNLPTVITQ